MGGTDLQSALTFPEIRRILGLDGGKMAMPVAKPLRRSSYIVFSALMCACGGGVCAPPVAILPIRVEVADAVTGDTLCEARVTLRSGEREQELWGDCPWAGGWGPGTYDVLAELDGYAPGAKNDVVVRDLSDDECTRWETVRVRIELTPRFDDFLPPLATLADRAPRPERTSPAPLRAGRAQ